MGKLAQPNGQKSVDGFKNLSIRVTDEEFDLIDKAASACGLTRSSLARLAVMNQLDVVIENQIARMNEVLKDLKASKL